MAFFDRLSKTVTEAGQKTIAKTKELADTSRLNSLISDEEKVINNLYFQIGKLYVALHKDDCEDDFTGMVNSIAEAEAKIKSYKQQIQEIKGLQKCDKCGAEVPSGAAFCSSCGNPMPKIETVEAVDIVKCGKCGADVKKGMRFCTSCGNPMVVAEEVVQETVVETPQEKICPGCGKVVSEELAFCTECGAKL